MLKNVRKLTEDMLEEQRVAPKKYFHEPKILSQTNKLYKTYVDLLTKEFIGNLDDLCETLMNPFDLIFTKSNIRELQFDHPSIKISGSQKTMGDGSTLILRKIRDKVWSKNAVLHDLCRLCRCLPKKYLSMHALSIKGYNYLLQEGYLRWVN